jgi:hypothetical protein
MGVREQAKQITANTHDSVFIGPATPTAKRTGRVAERRKAN